MFCNLTRLRSPNLSLWRTRRSPHHPERLPTVMPFVLGLAAGLMALGVLAGVSPLLLFAPLLFAGGIVLPLSQISSRVIEIAAIALLGLLILLLLPFRLEPIAIRQAMVLVIVVWVSLKIRQRLLRQEWQWASQKLLARLTEDQMPSDPQSDSQSAIAHALTMLKDLAEADAVIELRQLDQVTAQAIFCLPQAVLPRPFTTPALFSEAIAQNRCLYYPDYATTPNPAPVLLAQGVRSLAVMPLKPSNQPSSLQGAILLLWYRPIAVSAHLQTLIDSLSNGLSNLLHFQATASNPDLLQARFVAMLEEDITRREQIQESLQQQNRRTQLFAEVTLKIRQSLQLQEILQTAVTEVRTILNADRVLVYRLWANGTGSGIAEDVLPGFPSVLGQTFSEEVFPGESQQQYAKGRIGLVANVEQDQAIAPCLVEYLRQFKVGAKLVVPIVAQEELWGLLIAHQCDRPRQWTDFETDLLKQLADQIGIALVQAQLLEQETRQRQELARSNAELQQFAYIASHDLQEPLRMVTSYLQLIERRYQGKLDADADDFIAFAVDGAIRMKTLITDLLTYSRVGTHGRSFEHTDSTLPLQTAIANLKVAIEESNAVITYDSLPEVMADPSQLVQLFQNLIGNAIKFCGEAQPIVHVSAQSIEQPPQWLFSVQDNGIGIEPQYGERIFVIFQRLHKRSECPGTGIGLAICKKIVERHHGKIWMESEPDAETTFYFTLPTLET